MCDSGKVNILVNGEIVARDVPIQYCLIFARAVFDEFYADAGLKVIISRSENDDER